MHITDTDKEKNAMVVIDIPMPKDCSDCPLSYWIRTGEYEGMMMCNAMEARDNGLVFKESVDKGRYIIDEYAEKRPEGCPIKAVRKKEFEKWYELMEEIRLDSGR